MSDDGGAIRVVIVDDHPVFRAGLRACLEPSRDIIVAGEAGTAEQALECVSATAPDVVLLDLHLPDEQGLSVARRMINDNPGVSVLILTMSEEDADIVAAVRVGVRGYLLKSAGRPELLQAIRTASTGGSVFSAEVTARLAELIGQQPVRHVPFASLTPREREVLELVACGHDNRRIAKTLFVSDKTVRNHVSNIMAKLGFPDRAQMIVRAREAGLGVPSDGDDRLTRSR